MATKKELEAEIAKLRRERDALVETIADLRCAPKQPQIVIIPQYVPAPRPAWWDLPYTITCNANANANAPFEIAGPVRNGYMRLDNGCAAAMPTTIVMTTGGES